MMERTESPITLVYATDSDNSSHSSSSVSQEQALYNELGNISMEDLLAKYNLTESALCVLTGKCEQKFHLDSTSIVALILGFVAISLNITTFLAISQIRNQMTTHFRYIASLAASDLLVGASVTCHIINNTFNRAPPLGIGPNDARLKSRCIFAVIKAFNSMGLTVSLLNLTGMAVDHYFAILRPLHHQRLMSSSRGIVLILLSWIVAFLFGFSDFFAEADKIPLIIANHSVNYCEAIYITRYQEEYCLFVMAVITLSVMTFIYIRIYIKIRSHSKPGVIFRNNRLNRNKITAKMVGKNKRALITTLLILGTFILCWMPICLFQATVIIQIKFRYTSLESMRHILVEIDKHLYNLLIVNSIADPIIYAVRIQGIRLGYQRLLIKCRCWAGIMRDHSSSSLYRQTVGNMDFQTGTQMYTCESRSGTFSKTFHKF